jgi:hypothetical protein
LLKEPFNNEGSQLSFKLLWIHLKILINSVSAFTDIFEADRTLTQVAGMDGTSPLLELLEFLIDIGDGEAVATPALLSGLRFLPLLWDLVVGVVTSIADENDLIDINFLINGLKQNLNGQVVAPALSRLQILEEGADVAGCLLKVSAL